MTCDTCQQPIRAHHNAVEHHGHVHHMKCPCPEAAAHAPPVLEVIDGGKAPKKSG